MKPIFWFVLSLIIISGCAAPPQEFGFATDAPEAYLGAQLAFEAPSDWQNDKEILGLLNNLSKGFSNREEKLLAIAHYVSTSKHYNPETARTQTERSLLEIFQAPEGVCYDGAMMLAGLARLSGIPARVVFPLVGSHAFVQAYIGGRWLNLDATFGDVRYDFQAGQPIYLYSSPNPKALQRRFVKTEGFFVLSYPVVTGMIDGDLVVAQISRKTEGWELVCNAMECESRETSLEFQPLTRGFEMFLDTDTKRVEPPHKGYYQIPLPAGIYELKYLGLESGVCHGQAILNLSKDYRLELSQLSECGGSLRALKSAIRG